MPKAFPQVYATLGSTCGIRDQAGTYRRTDGFAVGDNTAQGRGRLATGVGCVMVLPEPVAGMVTLAAERGVPKMFFTGTVTVLTLCCVGKRDLASSGPFS